MTERPRILIVDDEPDLTASLASFFERSGFTVAVSGDGADALDRAAHFAPHVILLDVLMPGLNGREVLRRLRQRDPHTAVIMLTKVGDATERGLTLEEGADDYVNKPFDSFELLARVRAVLRRVGTGKPAPSTAARLRCYDLVLDRRAGRALLHGKPLAMQKRTFAVLEYLLCHPDELITRDRLLTQVWDMDTPIGERIVDNRVCELRQLLGDNPDDPRYIETVPGQGYRFIGPVEIAP
jgi:DNA-binding response OmpR family regulator